MAGAIRPAAIALALALVLAPRPSSAQEADEGPEAGESIVITGIRIGEFRDRLAACLARNCPTDEDADATLALAEALFIEGDYAEARRVVQASLQRNRDGAADFPEPVSDLYRAHSRLSRHLGFDSAALRSSHNILDALQEGLPVEDHRHFTARLELAEAQMFAGRLGGALRELERLKDVARRSGREDVVTMAELRGLWYQHIADRNGAARGRLIEMSRSTDPASRMRMLGAKVLLARIYRLEGQHERAEALLREVGRGSSVQRRLLYSPPYQLQVYEMGTGEPEVMASGTGFNRTLARLPDNYEDKWIDVGFWVDPDGQVTGLEILRRGSESSWAQPLLRSIRRRRYSSADESTYRLERYTYTAAYERAEATSGSRMRRRSPNARVEYFDLTANAPPPPSRPEGE